RISATIAVVVVLPFVAETTAVPAVSRPARRSIAPRSSSARSLAGLGVAPAAPRRRESAATPRAAAISSPSGGWRRIRRAYRDTGTGSVRKPDDLTRRLRLAAE